MKKTNIFLLLAFSFEYLSSNAQNLSPSVLKQLDKTEKVMLNAPQSTNYSIDDSTTKQYLLQLDRKIQEAVVVGDTALLDNVLADDFLFTHGFMKGGQENKVQWRSLATRTPAFFFYRKVDSSVVELHGDVALVMGTLSVKRGPIARRNEKENYCYTLGYVHLYAYRNNRWEFLSHRTTKSITESKSCE